MAPGPWDASAPRPTMTDSSNGSKTSRPTTASTQKGKMSKAERLLGVADTSQMVMPRPHAAGELNKKPSRRGFASAFADLKGALSTSRYGSRGRRTPTSPGFGTADSDSMTSMTSPTLDTSRSTSTLPSYHEQPVSPYFSNRGSEPGSPGDADIRLEYHAALNPARYKVASDMPSISEQFDAQEDQVHELPPLEKPILSTSSKPETPKPMSPFSPINRLRSPSNLSVTTDSTAKAKLFGRRSSKRYTKELYLDYPSTPSTEHHASTTQPPMPPPISRQDSSAVEQWLARTDLERRPSMSSTLTRSTLGKPAPLPAPFSPTSSQVSVRTLTTQKEVVVARPRRRAGHGASAPEEKEVVTGQTSQRLGKKNAPNLYLQSVLSLSSSEDESDDEPERGAKVQGRNVVYDGGETTPQKKPRATSFASSTTSAPQFLQMQREVILSKSNSKRRSKRPQIQVPPPMDDTDMPFSAVDWRAGDESELASLCAAATDRAMAEDRNETKEARRETRKNIDSMLLSPTSRVMVVSKKEERLLAQMREKRMDRDMASTTDESGGESRPPSQPPIIQISPSRRLRPSESDPALQLGESSVINFPAPPGTTKPSGGRTRTYSLSLALSKETLSEMTNLPEVAYGSDQPPPLPTGSLLSPDATSSFGSTTLSISELGTSPLASSRAYFNLPSGIRELQGSFPEPPSVLTLEPRRTRSQRASSNVMYNTGLEGRDRDGSVLDDEFDGDMAKYVMSSVL